jgi:predicted nucleic acid-binding protein
MRAVSNTPISNLAIIGHLSLIRSQFSETGYRLRFAANCKCFGTQPPMREDWIRTANPIPSSLLKVLSPRLHRGEAEAIALAAEPKVDIVLMD